MYTLYKIDRINAWNLFQLAKHATRRAHLRPGQHFKFKRKQRGKKCMNSLEQIIQIYIN